MKLYDYIYVDIDKVISLYSQLTGGVVELRESTNEYSRNNDNKRKYDFKVFKHDAGGSDTTVENVKEIIKPHHSFLSELESELSKGNHLIDLNECGSLKDIKVRNNLKNTFCVKITGRCVIEDYERIKNVADAFPDIVQLINNSHRSSIQDSPEYISVLMQVEQLEKENSSCKDRNIKSANKRQILKLKKGLQDNLDNSSQVEGVEKWVLDGMKTWIDTFLPGVINLRVYLDSEYNDEHIFGHLKKECFEESDLNSFHFTHGSMPTEPFTLIGIISSVPTENEDTFNPLKEFSNKPLNENESIENAFRGVFRGFDGFEQMIRTCRYPRIMVHPLMVYRYSNPNV